MCDVKKLISIAVLHVRMIGQNEKGGGKKDRLRTAVC